MVLGPLELFGDTGALDALLGELFDDLAELTVDELVNLVAAHLEIVLLLQAEEHVAEVVADKVLEERVGVIVGVNVVLLEYLVGEIGACLEGKTLRLAEGVVTVEEDVFDLDCREAAG